jgi:hypothetical protein
VKLLWSFKLKNDLNKVAVILFPTHPTSIFWVIAKFEVRGAEASISQGAETRGQPIPSPLSVIIPVIELIGGSSFVPLWH